MTTTSTGQDSAPASPVNLVHEPDRWQNDPEAGCNQLFALTLLDDYVMYVDTHHGYLFDWALKTAAAEDPSGGPVGGKFEVGRFEMPAAVELATSIRGAELVEHGETPSQAVLAAWVQAHSFEADDDERTGFETPAAEVHTMQEDVLQLAEDFARGCDEIRVHLNPEGFDEYRGELRRHGDSWLLPFAHVEVVRDDQLTTCSEISFEATREEIDFLITRGTTVRWKDGRGHAQLFW